MKIPKKDLAIILRESKKIARRYSRSKKFYFYVGKRYNVDDETIQHHYNIALVAKQEDWEDTDLWDKSPFEDVMTKELETTLDGRAIFDFYIYEDEDGEKGDLICNSQAYFENNKLNRIDADIVTTWSR
jgi:hypothetical protein